MLICSVMHRRAPLVWLGIEALVLAGVSLHAGVRQKSRAADGPAIDAVSRLVPGADLSLAGAARHLRFSSLEEPGAAFADGPASLDTDPAGGAMAPPIEIYVSIDGHEVQRPLPGSSK